MVFPSGKIKVSSPMASKLTVTFLHDTRNWIIICVSSLVIFNEVMVPHLSLRIDTLGYERWHQAVWWQGGRHREPSAPGTTGSRGHLRAPCLTRERADPPSYLTYDGEMMRSAWIDWLHIDITRYKNSEKFCVMKRGTPQDLSKLKHKSLIIRVFLRCPNSTSPQRNSHQVCFYNAQIILLPPATKA